MKWEFEHAITEALTEQGYQLPKSVRLDPPANPDFGHYATNIAFQLAKPLKTSPKELAQTLCEQLNRIPNWQGQLHFSPLNGFINLQFSDAFLWEKSQMQTPSIFPKTSGKWLLEYVSANPTGPLHIGHGRWAALGDALYRLQKAIGQSIDTEFYINDAGNQIAKLQESVAAIKAGKAIPEDGYHGAYVHELAASDEDPVLQNLKMQKETLTQFRTEFSNWFSEKSLYQTDEINAVLSRLEERGHTFTQDGALWFRSTQWGDDKDRVLVKSDGAYTYFLVDLVYHFDKIQRGYTRLVNIWGADHHGYIKRVKAGLAAMISEEYLKDTHLKIMIGQLVNLFRNGEPVRMSKRTGEMITLQEVIEEIGTDATRYFLLEKSPDTHVEFDLTLANKKSSDNPVFYVQYAHARLNSIQEKAKEAGLHLDPPTSSPELSPEERALLWHGLQRNDVLWESAQLLAPHHLVGYAYQLAKKVQLFYEKSPILKAEPEVQAKRLAIVDFAKKQLASALDVLGISAPERM